MATILELAKEMIDGRRQPAPIAALLGFRLTAVAPGRATVELAADERLANPMGTLHGGVMCDIADAAMGMAFASTLDEGETFTTLELKINFVRAITQATGRVHAEGSVVHSGGRVATIEARVHDDSGALYAHATSTCLILRGTR